jgi:hypothetical protein
LEVATVTTAPWITCVTAADDEAWKLLSPEYAAMMLWLPAVRVDVA